MVKHIIRRIIIKGSKITDGAYAFHHVIVKAIVQVSFKRMGKVTEKTKETENIDKTGKKLWSRRFVGKARVQSASAGEQNAADAKKGEKVNDGHSITGFL